ncbi:hypothetical protein PM082_019503 [Marasmius tenuissimus]|nr:hypothetical protein PM082_019503 [Marasmius tenuissimus]
MASMLVVSGGGKLSSRGPGVTGRQSIQTTRSRGVSLHVLVTTTGTVLGLILEQRVDKSSMLSMLLGSDQQGSISEEVLKSSRMNTKLHLLSPKACFA